MIIITPTTNTLKLKKMNYIMRIFYFLFVIALLFGCNKHEVVPPPDELIHVNNRFYGKVNGVDIELTRYVNGYMGSAQRHVIFHSNAPDSIVYYSTFKSPNSLEALMIGHGSIIAELESDISLPDKKIFDNFYTNYANQTPSFSLNGTDGFTVSYTDKNGTIWQSNQSHSYPLEDVQYTEMSLQSDTSGDYALFTVVFNTYLYSPYGDSILMTDAHYTGGYKR